MRPGSLHPMSRFTEWWQAVDKSPVVNLATCSPEGKPSSRQVLLRVYDEIVGFAFYTNYNSIKGQHIAANPYVALNFYWPSGEATGSRQVRVEGKASKAPEAMSETYFRSRPREHQISAWASLQSEEIKSDTPDAFQQRLDEETSKFLGMNIIPRPPHCGLYVVVPDRIEFWEEGEARRHHRDVYQRNDTTKQLTESTWSYTMLFP